MLIVRLPDKTVTVRWQSGVGWIVSDPDLEPLVCQLEDVGAEYLPLADREAMLAARLAPLLGAEVERTPEIEDYDPTVEC